MAQIAGSRPGPVPTPLFLFALKADAQASPADRDRDHGQNVVEGYAALLEILHNDLRLHSLVERLSHVANGFLANVGSFGFGRDVSIWRLEESTVSTLDLV